MLLSLLVLFITIEKKEAGLNTLLHHGTNELTNSIDTLPLIYSVALYTWYCYCCKFKCLLCKQNYLQQKCIFMGN
tara:strand:+ start:85 stop:309 length:225 start_codon:yes stop_codon:yes gene_type:complete